MKEEQTINGLPKNWKLKKLSEIAKFIDYRGRTPKKTASGIPLITAKNVKMGYINEEPREFIAEEDYASWMTRGFPKIGDVLFTTEAPLGNVAQLKTTERIALAQRMITFQAFELMDSSFLKYGLMSPQFQELLNSKGTGTTVKGIKAAILKQLEFVVPPKEDQKQIVSKIEELFSELDKGIEELKTAGQQLKVYRQAVLKWAFEGKLTNEDVKDGELPEEWKSKAINEVAHLNPKIPDRENIADELEVQFLPMKLVEEIINKFHLTETKKYKEAQKGSYTPFINGDVIFAKVTPCMENGKIAVVENLKNGIGYGSSEFHVIRCSNKLLNKYLFYFIVQDKFRNEAANAMTGAVGLRRVPKQFIENYFVPLPTIEEQQQIIQEIESRLSVCDKIEETITASVKQAEALRQSILKKAFEGKLLLNKTPES